MKISLIFCVAVLLHAANCHMPTLYEFCSHVVGNGNASQSKCDSSQCQGRPGKRGARGHLGLPGMKGQKGEQGTAAHLEERVINLENDLASANQIIKALPKSAYCYMGMRNRDIPDSAITASSINNGNHDPYDGRLDNRGKSGDYGAWCARINKPGEWLQIDFGKPTLVGGLITQGRENGDWWVRSFKISCGTSTSALSIIQENGVDKIFTGNSDRDTKKINMFPKPITCRYIRVHVLTWLNHICMRAEFIKGMCYDLYA